MHMMSDFIHHNPTEIIKVKGSELQGKILPNNTIVYNIYSNELVIGDGCSKYEEIEPIHTSQNQIDEIKQMISTNKKYYSDEINKLQSKITDYNIKMKSKYELFLAIILIEFGILMIIILTLLGLW